MLLVSAKKTLFAFLKGINRNALILTLVQFLFPQFLEWQSCHSSAEGFGFYQNYYTKEIEAWLYICQFSIFLFIKKLIYICINGPGCFCDCFSFPLIFPTILKYFKYSNKILKSRLHTSTFGKR